MSLKILFGSAVPHLPQMFGGIATNTHELIAQLAECNHAGSVLARLSYGNVFGLRTASAMRLRGDVVSRDTDLGYPVTRTRYPWAVIDQLPRPDVAVVQDGSMLRMIEAFRRAGIPTLAYLHGLEFEDWTVDGRPIRSDELPCIPYIANSLFTAAGFQRRYGFAPVVIRPMFHADRYRSRGKASHVTFINPVPEKGLDIALALARSCPEISFVFVKGWPKSLFAQIALQRSLRDLPNVELRERTRDMREVFATTRLLLAPSVWNRETWGRVASEAHCSAIPVLGSNRGGLPEAIGPGGVVVPFDAPIEAWVTELRRLWFDDAWYQEKADAGRAYSERADLDVANQAKRFLDVIGGLLQELADGRADDDLAKLAGAMV